MKETIKLTESEVAAACIRWCEKKLGIVSDLRLTSETEVRFVHGVGRDTKHEMEDLAKPGDILIRIPASGGAK